MSRTEAKVTVNNFVGGLTSDYHELNSPPNTTIDEDNCDLDRKGSRKRRLGIDFEDNFQKSTVTFSTTDWETMYVGTFEWKSVNEDGTQNFLVTQGGNILSFFNMNNNTLSAGEMAFTIDLDDHLTPGYSTSAPYPTSMASGKGLLFVVGEAIEPFYVTYDPVAISISITPITIKIRDLALQDHALLYTDQPTVLTDAQRYDLLNQGWGAVTITGSSHDYNQTSRVLNYYYDLQGTYPPKSKSWWVGKITSITHSWQMFDIATYNSAYVGSTLAPLGTFILNFFNQDRTGAVMALPKDWGGPDIPYLPIVVQTGRPTSVAFMSGRVFYGYKNKILFSQVLLDDLTVAGNCYQQADPTAEKINDLIATDGGVLTIIDAATIFAFQVFENALFVFTSNGVWALGGSTIGAGFSAIDFSIYKVTEAGVLSSRSIVSVLGAPVWWGKDGIYRLVGDPAKQGYSADNIIQKKEKDGKGLQLFYNVIPPLSKVYATGAYDHIKKVITWIYNSTDTVLGDNPYACNTVLNYDTILDAFYKYSLAPVTDLAGPYIVDVFDTLDIIATIETDPVIDLLGNIVIDIATDNVTTNTTILGNSANTTSSLKFFTFYFS